MLDVVTIGETMVAFTPTERTPIRYASSLGKTTAGAESNVAVGLAKLGKRAGWFTKLGEDEFGEFIKREIRGEGVDVSEIIEMTDAPTGIMFKQVGVGQETSVFYYRKNSAASTMCSKDIPYEYIKSAKILHISGITPALSKSCKEMTLHVMQYAKEQGIKVSFDPNIRLKLWSLEEAKDCLVELLDYTDILFIGDTEADMLLGTHEAKEVISLMRKKGIGTIALKLGAEGAVVADMEKCYKIEPYPTVVVDNIGAGDAFNAGFLCGMIEGKDLESCGKMGAVMGSLAVSSLGDVEGLPNRKQLENILNKKAVVYR